MPQREEAPIGAPCWIDLFTSDPDKSRSFYGELFGWTSQEAGEEYGGYINFSKDGVPVAGRQVVQNGDLVTRIEQLGCYHAADVAGAPRYEDVSRNGHPVSHLIGLSAAIPTACPIPRDDRPCP